MKKMKRIFPVFLCILLISISMLSILFISTHAEHDCAGDGCATCMHLQQAASFIERTDSNSPLHSNIQLYFLVAALLVCAAISNSVISLVSQKMRMNN